MLRVLLSAGVVAVSAETTLTITPGTQTGFFKTGSDIGSMNPHDYRPNEFVTNDFVFEGLTAWDGEHTEGADGVFGTDDDFVAPSLAISWTTNLDSFVSAPTAGTPYEITFKLREGVTFHDGSPWNAAAAKANFDQIMGGYGGKGDVQAMKGMHDWLGFTQSLDAWSIVDDMTFKLTFGSYYEAALRELSFIRPFRMISVAALPSMENGELSHIAWKWGYPREFPWKCWAADDPRFTGGKAGKGLNGQKQDPCYTMRGVKAPIGTGPYMVIDKLLKTPSGASRRLPASEFNATCYTEDKCTYNEGEYVAEVLFKKFEGHYKNPTYDNIIMKSYDSVKDIKKALEDGSLDIAYGVQTLHPSAFLSLATAEGGAEVVAHKAPTDLNTRLFVFNSAGRLDSADLRKLVMGILLNARKNLLDGELAEEEPMDTLFDPALPHCSGLSKLSSSEEVAATKSEAVTAASITQPLRLMYKPDVKHEAMIVGAAVVELNKAGIDVSLVPVDKSGYNNLNCQYMHAIYYDEADRDPNHPYKDEDYHAWDIAYSETWGPPYDATSKLWDMTHGELSGWCSAEADAPAVSNMASMSVSDFAGKVRSLSTTVDKAAREALYTEVLTTLHNEAIFLPLTAKRQTAVVNKRVSGFEFGFMEFDLPLANLEPAAATGPDECELAVDWMDQALANGWKAPCPESKFSKARKLEAARRKDKLKIASK